jgi:hypothetical protein
MPSFGMEVNPLFLVADLRHEKIAVIYVDFGNTGKIDRLFPSFNIYL